MVCYGPWYHCDNSGTTARTGLNLVLLDTPAWLMLKSLNSWQLSKATWEVKQKIKDDKRCNKNSRPRLPSLASECSLAHFEEPQNKSAMRQGITLHHNSWCCKVTRSTPYALAWMPRHFVPVNTITAVAHHMRTVCAAWTWRTFPDSSGSGLESLSKADLCTVGYVPSGRFRFSALRWV
jgi:hypothetical protein